MLNSIFVSIPTPAIDHLYFESEHQRCSGAEVQESTPAGVSVF